MFDPTIPDPGSLRTEPRCHGAFGLPGTLLVPGELGLSGALLRLQQRAGAGFCGILLDLWISFFGVIIDGVKSDNSDGKLLPFPIFSTFFQMDQAGILMG